MERPEPLMRNKDIGHESPLTEKAQQIQPAWAVMESAGGPTSPHGRDVLLFEKPVEQM